MSAPQKIGGYPIERELGRGGMGIVYLGKDAKLGRSVAIKVLPEAFAEDPERLARFEREAKMLAALHHPNIAGIYGLEEEDGHRFLSLEYVEGPTLAERLTRGPLPVDETLDVARQITAAVEAAHDSGVIHRDLKPGNIKLTPSGAVKVLDFGLAKGAGTSESSPDLSQSPTLTYTATGAGVILGTAAYMSPEQARGKTLDRRTDIWSFGCVLYEMLTGRQLFSGETASDTIAKILERDPDWGALPSRTPERIRDLLRRCLEKDARKRLRDVGDARIELEDVLAARVSQSRIAVAELQARRRAGGPGPIVAYVIAAVAIAVAAIVLLRPMMKGNQPRAIRLTITEPVGATLGGDRQDCAFAPDGHAVVFVAADSSETPRLWLRPLETLDSRPMPGTDGATQPFWSPDSKWVAFFADGKLKKARVDGGVEMICEAPNPRGGSWSPRGTIVFAPGSEGPVYSVSDAGGEPRPVTTLDSTRHETAHRFPSFLPDGSHFLYITLPGGARGLQVRVGSVDGRSGHPFLEVAGAPVYAAPGYLVFMRSRHLVAQPFDALSMRLKGDPVTLPDVAAVTASAGSLGATVSATGALAYMNGAVTNNRLVWFNRSGHVISTMHLPPAQYQQPYLSPDGRTIAVTILSGGGESDLWMVSLDREVATRFTYGPRNNSLGIWSHDGNRIAFESNRNGHWDIFVKATSGALPETVLVEGPSQFKHASSWSPDDRLLLYWQSDQKTGYDIWVVPTDGSGPPRPYLTTPFREMFPSFSADGRWVSYVSDESGRTELYAQSFPVPGHKYRITTNGCLVGGFTTSGRQIGMVGLDGVSLYAADVAEQGTTLKTGVFRLLFRAPTRFDGGDATADNQRFLLAVPEGKATPPSITVLLDWKAALAASTVDGP